MTPRQLFILTYPLNQGIMTQAQWDRERDKFLKALAEFDEGRR